jgi:hypothetical protein
VVLLRAVCAHGQLKGLADMMIANKKMAMPDKITMINLVWSAMIAVMLTATVTLYQDRSDVDGGNYPQVTGRYSDISYY